MKRRFSWIAAGAALVALVAWTGSAAAAGGNSNAAHACQQGGYAQFVEPDGSTFGNTGECVSFAAHGGALVTPTPTPSSGGSSGIPVGGV